MSKKRLVLGLTVQEIVHVSPVREKILSNNKENKRRKNQNSKTGKWAKRPDHQKIVDIAKSYLEGSLNASYSEIENIFGILTSTFSDYVQRLKN